MQKDNLPKDSTHIYVLSFFITVTILILIYILRGVYPFGQQCFLPCQSYLLVEHWHGSEFHRTICLLSCHPHQLVFDSIFSKASDRADERDLNIEGRLIWSHFFPLYLQTLFHPQSSCSRTFCILLSVRLHLLL